MVRDNRLLWIAPRAPAPARRGDQLRLVSLAREISKLGYRQDLWVASATDREIQLTRDLGLFELIGRASQRLPINPLAMAVALSRGRPLQTSLYAPGLDQRTTFLKFLGPSPLARYQGIVVQLLRMADWLPLTLRRHAVLDSVDTLSRSLSSQANGVNPLMAQAYRHEARLMRRLERSAASEYRAVTVVSPEDAAAWPAGAPCPQPQVVRNGVDPTRFGPSVHSASLEDVHRRPVFVFHGNLGYVPNQLAVRTLADRIFPEIRRHEPDAELWIVGARPARWMVSGLGLGVRLFADVPDVLPFLQESDVALHPVGHGSGMQNKILEALASGLPVVATAPAVARLGMRPAPFVIAAQAESDFATEALALLAMVRSPAGLGLRADAHRSILEEFSWKTGARRILELAKEPDFSSRSTSDSVGAW